MSQEIKEKQDDNTSSSNWSIKKKIMNILQMISKSEDNIETTAVTVPLYDSNRKPWEVYDKLSGVEATTYLGNLSIEEKNAIIVDFVVEQTKLLEEGKPFVGKPNLISDLQRSSRITEETIIVYLDFMTKVYEGQRRHKNNDSFLGELISYHHKLGIDVEYMKKCIKLGAIYNHLLDYTATIINSVLSLEEKQQWLQYLFSKNTRGYAEIFERLTDGYIRDEEAQKLLYTVFFEYFMGLGEKVPLTWFFAKRDNHSKFPLEIILSYYSPLDGSEKEKFGTYFEIAINRMLDEVCSEGTAKASLDNPQAVKNILITPQFKLQVPYSHISAMIQRVLKARPYPSVGELKSLVGYYDLLDDEHKKIIEPLLYPCCQREAAFDHFRT